MGTALESRGDRVYVSRMRILKVVPVWIIAAIVSSSTVGIAEPNFTDLSPFKGSVRGNASIKTKSSKFRGKCRIRGAVPSNGRSAKLTVQSSVKVDRSSVKIDNVFNFQKSGVVKIKELAPGDTRGDKLSGDYTATGRTITFGGKWRLGKLKGTFEGTAKANSAGKVKIIYKVFIGGEEEPTYVYTYVGK